MRPPSGVLLGERERERSQKPHTMHAKFALIHDVSLEWLVKPGALACLGL